MRGKENNRCTLFCKSGITPAYAGKSYTQLFLATTPRDHPRVCGEKPALILRITVLQGSPPRMRGKVLVPKDLFVFGGITPAYAGKSSFA